MRRPIAVRSAADDFTGVSGTFNWADGDMADKTLNITILGDSEYENTEDFSFSIFTPTGGATLGTPNDAVVTITDDETAPSFSINDVS